MRFFLSLIVAFLLTLPIAQAEDLTIERLVASPALSGASARGVQVSPDGKRVTFLQGRADNQDQQDLWEYNIADGVTRMLVNSSELVAEETLDEVELARRERMRIFASGIIEYQWSPKGDALLFPLGGDIYYLKLGETPRQLTATDATETDAKISPAGGFVSFIREQNLYVINLESGAEEAITSTGGGAISYGMADFAAQEEMYRNTGYWWSPDDRWIAFTRMDETEVKLVNRYEIGADGVTTVPQRYPFAGTPNAVVQLFVFDMKAGATSEIGLGANKDFYLARVNFAPDNTLAVQKQTRDQKRLDLIFVNPWTRNQEVILTEKSKTWVELHSDLTFTKDSSQFIWSSERSGFNHLYLYNRDGSLVRQLSGGITNVSATGRSGGGLRALVENGGRREIWYTGWRVDATENHVFRTSLGDGKTMQMSADGGWYGASVASSGDFYVETGQSPSRPPYTAIRDRDGALLSYIVENALDEGHPYGAFLDGHQPREFASFKVEDGTELFYQITKPTGFDASKKYPAVVFLYGGPGVGQQVRKVWSVDFQQLLARNGYVVFTMDNRGSPNRGRKFADVLYRNMGDYEVRDQVAGTELLKALPYVDADNVGIHGWSYGGYMTLMSLLKSPDTWKAGIAGAPVTNWRLYDTHYTERYMADPNDGDGKYEASSPVTYADRLSDELLIVHGMADDNVFFDNTVQMIDALQKAGKSFDLMTYPGKRHRITGEAQQAHMYHMYKDFFERHLKGQ